jgi:hypothetical protein
MKVVLAVAAALVLVAPASASRYEPYFEIARAKFPATCAPIRVELVAFPEWAAAAGGLAYPERCLIQVPTDFNRWSKQDRCETLVHEVGHLAGIWWHSSNPRSVMYPHTNGQFKPCQRFKHRARHGIIEG